MIYVTRNREYHTRNNVVVAVRNRDTDQFIAEHEAIGMRLESVWPARRLHGSSLLFSSSCEALRTSALAFTQRPDKGIVQSYHFRCEAD